MQVLAAQYCDAGSAADIRRSDGVLNLLRTDIESQHVTDLGIRRNSDLYRSAVVHLRSR